ncbi:MAG: ribosomal RNA small subunit methyltransferase A [Candidatus Eisenbacteria bacterium]|uniref:Ribosomal RNA small subunit methyltransferase A n=1 Tax=Eiseniibacteriota bacterium TaxID=2212470 RepID=A0A938BPR3_UNCEI|nr:ribosomal RNA small subunit methyltransferase A [Candidatus Eisenbacteria bacterium]
MSGGPARPAGEAQPLPRGTRAWLRAAGIRPRRAWGQNFLVNARVAERIIDGWEIAPGTEVVEIGAGAGSLTLPLLARGLPVVAVERDPALCDLLRARATVECPGATLELREADILALDPASLGGGAARGARVLVGNLPYALTTAILLWAGRHREAFLWSAFMVQREYGERLLAEPGGAAYGSLSVWARIRYALNREILVRPASFWPIPKVDSLVVRLTPLPAPPVEVPTLELLERVVRAAFSERRKMLAQPLARALSLPRERVERALRISGVDPRKRAEACGLEDFAALTRALADDLG